MVSSVWLTGTSIDAYCEKSLLVVEDIFFSSFARRYFQCRFVSLVPAGANSTTCGIESLSGSFDGFLRKILTCSGKIEDVSTFVVLKLLFSIHSCRIAPFSSVFFYGLPRAPVELKELQLPHHLMQHSSNCFAIND